MLDLLTVVLAVATATLVSVSILQRKVVTLMATLDEVNSKLDTALAKVGEIGDQAKEIAQVVRDLRDAGGATPEQLDALAAKADAIAGSAQGAIDATKDVDPTP